MFATLATKSCLSQSPTSRISSSDTALSTSTRFPAQIQLIHTIGRRGRCVTRRRNGNLVHNRRPVNMRIESIQPVSRRFPCLHGHIHCSSHYLCLRRHRCWSWRLFTARQLSYLVADCYSWRCPLSLETTLVSIWTASYISYVADSKLCLQYRVCKEGL